MSNSPSVEFTRQKLKLSRKAIPVNEAIHEAVAVIDRSGLAPALQRLADKTADGTPRRGRPRSVPKVRSMLAAFMINGAAPGHRGLIIEVQRRVHEMTPEQRSDLELPYSSRTTYDHIHRFLDWLADTLNAAPMVTLDGAEVRLDRFEFMNRLIAASVITDLPHPEIRSVAADDTAIECWAALYGDPAATQITNDDDGSGYGDAPIVKAPKKGDPSSLQVRGIDERGRKIYTADPDARASYATATNSRSGHKFVGYHLFLAVATKSVAQTDGRESLTFGPAVPDLILGAHLTPGGDHRGEALVRILAHIKARHPKVDEVICDAGYTGAKPHRFFHPVRQLGLDVQFEIKKNQRGIRPFAGDALCLDGGFFSPLLPRDLQGVDKHGNNAPLRFSHWRAGRDARSKDEQAFNERAKYQMRRHSRPDRDGAIRLRCPFHGHRLRSPQVPLSMRAGHHVPLVVLPGATTQKCCKNNSGVITVSADDAIWSQNIPFGTTAWRMAYGRKNAAENANASLKGKYVNIESKYTQVLGAEKNTIFLAFALAGYNLDRLSTWSGTITRGTDKSRAKRRTGTWHRKDAA